MGRTRNTFTCAAVAIAFMAGAPRVWAQDYYPNLSGFNIKGVGVEERDNANVDEVAGNAPGFIVTHMLWARWGDTPPTNGVCTGGAFLFQGRCFTVDAPHDTIVREYSARGINVTAVLYGVPGWANAGKSCEFLRDSQGNLIPDGQGSFKRDIFCSPNNAADYGRFAAMVATRYNGGPNGRIVNFIIHNEVNTNAYYKYFPYSCGGGACNLNAWTTDYANNFNAAYDAIKPVRPNAKVFVSFNGVFAPPDDINGGGISIKTFLSSLAPKLDVGQVRAWSVSAHPYANNFGTVHSPEDYPGATPGSFAQLAQWLRAAFPSKPSAWEITLSEGGLDGYLNSGYPDMTPDTTALQADYLCRAFRNVLGTPGINSYHYTSLTDHPALTGFGHYQGLIKCTPNADCNWPSRQYKYAWATWALANRADLNTLSCGFEDLPYARLKRYYHPNRGHWASTRTPPSGFNYEASWKILRNPEAGTRMLYEYRAYSGAYYWAGGHNFVGTTPDAAPGILFPLGPLGYVWTAPAAGRVPLYRCYVSAPGYETHFVADSNCGGWVQEELLGYALPG